MFWARKLAGEISEIWWGGHFGYDDILTETWLAIDHYAVNNKRLSSRYIKACVNQRLAARWADDTNVGMRFGGRIMSETNNHTFCKRTVPREIGESMDRYEDRANSNYDELADMRSESTT